MGRVSLRDALAGGTERVSAPLAGEPAAAPTPALSAAESSLASGRGPTSLGPTECPTTADGSSARCSTESGPRPQSAVPLVNATERPVWNELLTPSAPSARIWTQLAYDAADQHVVLFGGYNRSTAVLLNDTWTFSDGNWTKLSLTHAPSPRDAATMEYDAADGYVVLFGGWVLSEESTYVTTEETWKFADGSWTQLTPSSFPPARSGQSMTYDAADVNASANVALQVLSGTGSTTPPPAPAGYAIVEVAAVAAFAVAAVVGVLLYLRRKSPRKPSDVP